MNAKLAIDGGPKVRATPLPGRQLITAAEKAAVVALFDQAIAAGEQILGYNGPQEETYCKEFAAWLGGGFADGVNSGSNAVYVALRALDLEPFGEVIVGPVTDAGGIMPVAICNQIPVLPDSAPGSYNTGAAQIAARITDQTRAIIVTHLAGIPCEMDAIMNLARSRSIPVIEDCAQAHGTLYQGKLTGTFGDIATFSTMFGKLHVTGGQGGVVFTRDEKRYWRIRQMADRGKPFGLGAGRTNVVAALNCNMDELHACLGRVSLRRLPEFIAARRRIAAQLEKLLREQTQTVRLVTGPAGGESSYWFGFLRIQPDRWRVDKTQFAAAVGAEGLPVYGAGYYHVPTQWEWFQNRAATLPWSSPQYTGQYRDQPPLPNIAAAEATHNRLIFNECWTSREVEDLVAAVQKVEQAYLR